jgi:uncharacterized membrane protein YccF (DUF307 family)
LLLLLALLALLRVLLGVLRVLLQGLLLALLWLVCSDLPAQLVATVLMCCLRRTTAAYMTAVLCQLL